MTGSATLLLVAHGSRAPEANDAHLALTRRLAEVLDRPVRAAFLELADPDIPTSIDRAVADGATRVVLLPYFAHAGRHVREHLPAILDAARTRHPGTTIDLLAPFGDDDAVIDLLARQATRALER